MNDEIKKALEEIQILNKRRDKLQNVIKALQDICEHIWESAGNDSHKDYYKCVKCFDTYSA